jgi:hypothetical protein
MAAARWFIARDKVKVGPFSAADLKQLASFGLVQPGDHVWLDGATKWVLASSVPGLFPGAAVKKFWLVHAGQTHGPFVPDQIRAGLNAHQFTLTTQACADSDRQWMPLGHHAEFRDFKLETVALSPSYARLLVGSLEFDEATLHLAGKSGDALAKLISTLMDIKRTYAANAALVENVDATIAVLRAKREELSAGDA